MIIYADDQQLIDSGARQYQLGTAWCWYRRVNGQYDQSRVDVRAIDEACERSQFDYPFLADIEAFDVTTDYGLRQVKTALMRWRTNQPNRQVGLYDLIPIRNYTDPVAVQACVDVGDAVNMRTYGLALSRWRNQCRMVAGELLPLVDFVVPCLYLLNDDLKKWRAFVDSNLAIAFEFGLPVRPIVMASLHPGTRPISVGTLSQMIRWLRAYPIDSVMVHSADEYVTDPAWRRPFELAMQQPDDSRLQE